MTRLSDFTDDEVELITGAPGAVLEATVVADGRPSPIEFVKELSAGARVFKQAQRDENAFVRAVAERLRAQRSADAESEHAGRGLPESADAATAALDLAREASALLRERADAADAAAYTAWLQLIAASVASAAKSRSGGFFSKKVAVSDDEQAFLDRLAAAVDG